MVRAGSLLMADLPSPPPGVKFLPDPPPGVKFVADSAAPPPSSEGGAFERASKQIGRRIGIENPLEVPSKITPPSGPAGGVSTAAGLATASASALLGPEYGLAARTGMAVAGGLLSPYAEYVASKASGGNPELPDVKSAIRSGIINGLFEASAVKSPAIGGEVRATAGETARLGTQVSTEMSQLPEELRTPENIRAAAKNRDVLKKLGMNDQQISEALKDPAGTAEALQRSVDQGRAITDNFNRTVQAERGQFQQRFDAGYGAQKTATAPVDDLAKGFQDIAQGGGEHELTPAYKSFLQRKAKELIPDPLAGKFPPEQLATLTPQQRANLTKSVSGMQESPAAKVSYGAEAPKAAAPPPMNKMSVEDLAKLRTEMRENVPANPTNLDKKAAAAIDAQITQKWRQTLSAAGANNEQIGRLEGTYQDYGDFQKTISGLHPGNKDFGEQTADAFFNTAKQNPTLALSFVRMAQDAGTLPEFRESFMKQITQTMRGEAGGPINQRKALQTLQSAWRSTDDGKAVLTSVFGKNSPMADPVEFSKIVGSADNPEALKTARSSVSQFIRSPTMIARLATFYATYSLIVGSGSSPWTDMRKDPERAMTGLVGAMLTLGGINKVMSHLDPAAQRVYGNWVTNRDPAALEKLIRMSGRTATAIASQPTEPETPTR